MRLQYLKAIARIRITLRKFWQSNSGEWRWLNEKPIPIASLNRRLWQDSVPSTSFFVLLSLSVILSTLGLLANSVATIIGAMIIAPLMGPIIGMAYAVALGNRRLLRRASLTLLAGFVVSVLSSVIICYLVGIQTANPEINARAYPTLIDLVVALAAGAAGAFTKSRRNVADAFPGVAIAVALIPPVSVIGIGIATGSQTLSTGATLFFLTNLAGSILSGSLVFISQQYGSLRRAKSGLAVSVLALLLLGIPLGVSFQNLRFQSNTRQDIRALVYEQINTFTDNAEVQHLTVQRQNQQLVINLEIVTETAVSNTQINSMSNQLADELSSPVLLTVRVFPMTFFEVPSQPSE